jgi:hypothetical protein
VSAAVLRVEVRGEVVVVVVVLSAVVVKLLLLSALLIILPLPFTQSINE